MNPFTGTYTPLQWNKETLELEPDKDKSRTVLILEFVSDAGGEYIEAIFIDDDGSLGCDSITKFSNCQSTEWR